MSELHYACTYQHVHRKNRKRAERAERQIALFTVVVYFLPSTVDAVVAYIFAVSILDFLRYCSRNQLRLGERSREHQVHILFGTTSVYWLRVNDFFLWFHVA